MLLSAGWLAGFGAIKVSQIKLKDADDVMRRLQICPQKNKRKIFDR